MARTGRGVRGLRSVEEASARPSDVGTVDGRRAVPYAGRTLCGMIHRPDLPNTSSTAGTGLERTAVR